MYADSRNNATRAIVGRKVTSCTKKEIEMRECLARIYSLSNTKTNLKRKLVCVLLIKECYIKILLVLLEKPVGVHDPNTVHKSAYQNTKNSAI